MDLGFREFCMYFVSWSALYLSNSFASDAFRHIGRQSFSAMNVKRFCQTVPQSTTFDLVQALFSVMHSLFAMPQ